MSPRIATPRQQALAATAGKVPILLVASALPARGALIPDVLAPFPESTTAAARRFVDEQREASWPVELAEGLSAASPVDAIVVARSALLERVAMLTAPSGHRCSVQ